MPAGEPSSRRADGVRLVAFLLVAVGALVAGVGATRRWASIGFIADVEGAADVTVHGTDVWEGKVIVLGVTLALVLVLAMRLAVSPGARRVFSVAIVALGLLCVGLAVADAVRAEARFGGGDGLDRMVEVLARELGLPEEVVREQLEEQFARDLRVDLEPGLWVTMAGGVLLAAGGAMSLAWAPRRAAAEPARPDLG